MRNNRAEFDVTETHDSARDNFHEYIRQCIALGKWGTALEYTLEHERASVITKHEADEWLKTFAPHIDAMLLREAEAAGVLA